MAAMAGVASATLRNCLFCKRTDEDAHFLTSYSYCAATEECLANAWNYLDRPCPTGWKPGKTETLGTCLAEESAKNCPSYVSLPEKAQQTESRVWSLQSGTYCKVNIDATQFVARVLFDDVTDLGIDDKAGKIGSVMTFDAGFIGDVIIYNAAEAGTIAFTMTFSQASTLFISAAALASIPLLASF